MTESVGCGDDCAEVSWEHIALHLLLALFVWAGLAITGWFLSVILPLLFNIDALKKQLSGLEHTLGSNGRFTSCLISGYTILVAFFAFRSYRYRWCLGPEVAWVEVVCIAPSFFDMVVSWYCAAAQGQRHLFRFVSGRLIKDSIFLASVLSLGMIEADGKRTWFSFSWLASLRILDTWTNFKERSPYGHNGTKWQMAHQCLNMSCYVVFSAVVIMIFEILEVPNEDEYSLWTIFRSIYWVFCTISTVGFGDIFPITLIGRFFNIFVIGAGIGVFSMATNQLMETYNMGRLGKNSYFVRKGIRHIVVTGSPPVQMIKDLVLEFYHPDRKAETDGLEIVLLLPEVEMLAPVQQFLMRRANVHLAEKIWILHGSPLAEDDLRRVAIHQAEVCFLLPNLFSVCPVHDDTENIVRALALRRAAPQLRMICLLHKVENRQILLSAGCEVGDIVSLDRFKLELVGKTCMYRGFSTLVCNLCKMSGEEEEEKEEGAAKWRQEYGRGLGSEMYEIPLSNAYRAMHFGEVVLDILDKSADGDAYLIGLVEYLPADDSTERTRSVLLNPGSDYRISYHKETSGIFIAADKSSVIQSEGPPAGTVADSLLKDQWEVKGSVEGDRLDVTEVDVREAASDTQFDTPLQPATPAPLRISGASSSSGHQPVHSKDVVLNELVLQSSGTGSSNGFSQLHSIGATLVKEVVDPTAPVNVKAASSEESPAGAEDYLGKMKQNYMEAMETLKETLAYKSQLPPDVISTVVRGLSTPRCSPSTQNDPQIPHVWELPEITPPQADADDIPAEQRVIDRRLQKFHDVYDNGKHAGELPLGSRSPKGHILFCALGYDGADSLGLVHFVRPLRKYSMVPIVVLGPEQPKDWYTIAQSESVFFVAGSPLSLFDLERASFKSASAIFLSQASVPGEMIDPSIVDAEGIFASRLIESQLPPSSNIQVISELVFDSNYVFNPVGLSSLARRAVSGDPSSSGELRSSSNNSRPSESSESEPSSPEASELRGRDSPHARPGDGAGAGGLYAKDEKSSGRNTLRGVRAGGILGQMVNAKGKDRKDGTGPNAQVNDQGDDGRARSQMLSQIETSDYFRQARFASGQLFVSSLVTSLVVNTLFNPSLALLVQEMVSAQVVITSAPKEYVGASYMELFKCFLLKQNLVALGLFRRSQSYAHDLGHPKTSVRKVLDHHYMFTAPPAKDTTVEATDSILCIAAPRQRGT